MNKLIYKMLERLIQEHTDDLVNRPFEATVNELAFLVDEFGKDLDPEIYDVYNRLVYDSQLQYLETAVTNFMGSKKSSVYEIFKHKNRKIKLSELKKMIKQEAKYHNSFNPDFDDPRWDDEGDERWNAKSYSKNSEQEQDHINNDEYIKAHHDDEVHEVPGKYSDIVDDKKRELAYAHDDASDDYIDPYWGQPVTDPDEHEFQTRGRRERLAKRAVAENRKTKTMKIRLSELKKLIRKTVNEVSNYSDWDSTVMDWTDSSGRARISEPSNIDRYNDERLASYMGGKKWVDDPNDSDEYYEPEYKNELDDEFSAEYGEHGQGEANDVGPSGLGYRGNNKSGLSLRTGRQIRNYGA